MIERLSEDTKCWNCGEKNFETDPHYPSSLGIETNKHTCRSCGKSWQTLKDEVNAHSFVAPWARERIEENAKAYFGLKK